MIGVDPQSFTWNFYEWPDALNGDTVRAVNQTIEREYLFTEPQGYGARHTDGSEVKNISNIKIISWDKLADMLSPLVGTALQIGRMDFGYDLYDIHSSMTLNYNVYDSKSKDSYNWHIDATRQATNDMKFTLLINLSDEPYTGGELKVWPKRDEQCVDNFSKPGSAFMFKSHILHKVEPVISGVRKTLTMFLYGPRFR